MNNHINRFLSVMCLVALGAIGSPLFAQQAAQTSQATSAGTTAGSTNGQGITRPAPVPYSAEEVTVTTQTLADGTKITHKSLTKVYRDSQGRYRREWFKPGLESVGPDDLPLSVNITDPVVGVGYNLNPRDRTAQRRETRRREVQHLPQTTGTAANLTPEHPVPPRPTTEDLGTQVIEGLEAKGERFTRTIRAGAEGNDQPIQVTDEYWYSTNPRLRLIGIINDPRRGETVTRLTNLVLDEPPPELFQVPSDYTVQELQPVAKPEPPSE